VLVGAVAVLASVFAASAEAANMALDVASNAPYDDGWQSGDNGGSGFGPWTLATNNNNPSTGGFFIGSSTGNGNGDGNGDGDIDTAGEAFGLYANSGDEALATRSFTGGPLGPGQTFSIDFDNGFIDFGNEVVFRLFGNGNTRLVFGFGGGQSNYVVIDGTGLHDTGVPFTDEGLSVDVTLLLNNGYELSINGTQVFTGTIGAGDPIDEFGLLNDNAGSGSSNDAFFNSFAVTGTVIPEPATIVLAGLVLLGFIGRSMSTSPYHKLT
jgi:hypothetical protein